MTAVKVVDASAAGAILFHEPDGLKIAAQLEGADLMAPALIQAELANVYVRKVRSGGMALGAAETFAPLREFNISLFHLEPDAVARLALSTGLSGYDASYLLLAKQQGAELVTLDEKLRKAAGKRAK